MDLIENVAEGIGDAIMYAWMADHLHRRGDEARFYLRRHLDWISPMLGTRSMLAMRGAARSTNPAKAFKEIAAFERDRREGKDGRRCEHRMAAWALYWGLDVRGKLERPTIALPQQAMDMAEHWWHMAGKLDGRDESMPRVLIAPNCFWPQRSWPKPYWTDLAISLHHSGLTTMMLCGTASEVEERQVPFAMHGTQPLEVWALMMQADIVIGNDSAPAHVASALGKHTFVLSGPTRTKWVFGHVPDKVYSISADDVPCTGCDLSSTKGYRGACDSGCQSLMALKPRRVYEAVMEHVKNMEPACQTV